MTSFQCVLLVKSLLRGKIKRVGHAGTLDPFARGLMIIGIGREATRRLDQIKGLDKTYYATGLFGQLTDTYDLTGQVMHRVDKTISRDDLEQAIVDLRPSYLQTPPIYSAVQYQGRRLYTLAREKTGVGRSAQKNNLM